MAFLKNAILIGLGLAVHIEIGHFRHIALPVDLNAFFRYAVLTRRLDACDCVHQ